MKKFIGVLFALLLALPTTASAQEVVSDDALGVSATVPAGWARTEGNDRAVFSFSESETNSQIEVIGAELLTPDVADVFFDTFHETLASAEFLQRGREDRTIGDVSGTETTYSFTHSSVTLKLAVFQFVRESNAYLVVAYVQEDFFDDQAEQYRNVI
ncbi:MAG: hypothetical protein ACI82G_002145, partial [Bradymonadia bacterium]